MCLSLKILGKSHFCLLMLADHMTVSKQITVRKNVAFHILKRTKWQINKNRSMSGVRIVIGKTTTELVESEFCKALILLESEDWRWGWACYVDIWKRMLQTEEKTSTKTLSQKFCFHIWRHTTSSSAERKEEVLVSGVGVSGRETGEPAFILSSEKGSWGLLLPFWELIQQRAHQLWADMTCIGSQRSFH